MALSLVSVHSNSSQSNFLFQSNVAASNAKLALFYDWLFFDPEKESIMNIGIVLFFRLIDQVWNFHGCHWCFVFFRFCRALHSCDVSFNASTPSHHCHSLGFYVPRKNSVFRPDSVQIFCDFDLFVWATPDFVSRSWPISTHHWRHKWKWACIRHWERSRKNGCWRKYCSTTTFLHCCIRLRTFVLGCDLSSPTGRCHRCLTTRSWTKSCARCFGNVSRNSALRTVGILLLNNLFSRDSSRRLAQIASLLFSVFPERKEVPTSVVPSFELHLHSQEFLELDSSQWKMNRQRTTTKTWSWSRHQNQRTTWIDPATTVWVK